MGNENESKNVTPGSAGRCEFQPSASTPVDLTPAFLPTDSGGGRAQAAREFIRPGDLPRPGRDGDLPASPLCGRDSDAPSVHLHPPGVLSRLFGSALGLALGVSGVVLRAILVTLGPSGAPAPVPSLALGSFETVMTALGGVLVRGRCQRRVRGWDLVR